MGHHDCGSGLFCYLPVASVVILVLPKPRLSDFGLELDRRCFEPFRPDPPLYNFLSDFRWGLVEIWQEEAQ